MDDKNWEVSDLHATALLVAQIEVEILKGLVVALAEKSNMSTISGVPITSWLYDEKRRRLSKALEEMENSNPEMAAILQSIVDESDARTGATPPEPE